MSFYDYISTYNNFNFDTFFEDITENTILNILNKDRLNKIDFWALLSPLAGNYLEPIARKAEELSLKHFGRTILLYTPLYLSNYCVNRCAYCSYNIDNSIKRKKLNLEEIEAEAKAISSTGLKHILVLTGENEAATPVSYIIDAVKILRKYFDSISIEIYPLTEDQYKEVINAGVDGLTVYQEVYNEKIYDKIHISGPKKNYQFRIDAPERGCKAKMRSVNIGALLGLDDWRMEAFKTGLHGEYLQNKYPDVEVSISIPRIRPHVGVFTDIYDVNDKNLVQILLAMRLFLPRAGITLSTREKASLRNNLIYLGVTKMSAGVSTEVGGHALSSKGDSQFDISDDRSVNEIKHVILAKGYQPIFKDWMSF